MLHASIARPRRVGHKGAAHIEPGNTLASFDAALRHGVDMIELDVLSERPAGSGRALVRAVAEGGGDLYVWTVDSAVQIARLTAMGVDGIITNDPRLFEAAAR